MNKIYEDIGFLKSGLSNLEKSTAEKFDDIRLDIKTQSHTTGEQLDKIADTLVIIKDQMRDASNGRVVTELKADSAHNRIDDLKKDVDDNIKPMLERHDSVISKVMVYAGAAAGFVTTVFTVLLNAWPWLLSKFLP